MLDFYALRHLTSRTCFYFCSFKLFNFMNNKLPLSLYERVVQTLWSHISVLLTEWNFIDGMSQRPYTQYATAFYVITYVPISNAWVVKIWRKHINHVMQSWNLGAYIIFKMKKNLEVFPQATKTFCANRIRTINQILKEKTRTDEFLEVSAKQFPFAIAHNQS